MERITVKRRKKCVRMKQWLEKEAELLTSELLSNHQKKVRVLGWLGQTTAVRLVAFPLMATIGAERYTRSTGPEAVTHIHRCIKLTHAAITE